MTVHRDKFLVIILTICINFWNIFLEWKSTCFGQFLSPSSGGFHCKHSNGICHTGLLCVQWKLLMMDRYTVRNIYRFSFQNKFEKLVHLIGFATRNMLLKCMSGYRQASHCFISRSNFPYYHYIQTEFGREKKSIQRVTKVILWTVRSAWAILYPPTLKGTAS